VNTENLWIVGLVSLGVASCTDLITRHRARSVGFKEPLLNRNPLVTVDAAEVYLRHYKEREWSPWLVYLTAIGYPVGFTLSVIGLLKQS
jgi:hypothetical protein